MKLSDYLKDKIIIILMYILSIIFINLILFLFNINKYLIAMVSITLVITNSIIIIYDYFRKRSFYKNLERTLDKLDKKCLAAEIINKPNFLEGKILYDSYYLLSKFMMEEINSYKYNSDEFVEYLELWCHEIKTPIATSNLIIENNGNEVTYSIKEELDKIDYYIEQVLYYSKMKNANKDYIIKDTNLKSVVQNVIKKNKKDIWAKKIRIDMDDSIENVYSDSKWLVFIINQIIVNSIKYGKDENAIIKIKMVNNSNNKVLEITDNGIGIPNNELDNVFEKGFTGSNGRKKYNSTGIGLYLCKKLTEKLGHNIKIVSELNGGTTVSLIFPNNSLTEQIR